LEQDVGDRGASVSEHTVLLHEGRNSKEILPVLMQESGVTIPINEWDSFIEGKRQCYRQIVDVEFYPGAIDTVTELKARGYLLAIVTACAQKTMLKSLAEEHRILFDLIQTGDDVPRAKPNPDPYDLARKKLLLKAEQCLVVENAPLGIASAKAAGMRCVAVETTLGREYLWEADYIISNVNELLDLQVLNSSCSQGRAKAIRRGQNFQKGL